MKKSVRTTLIVAACVLGAGIIISGIAFAAMGFNFDAFGSGGQRVEVSPQMSEITEVYLETDVKTLSIVPSSDGKVHISYTDDPENPEYELKTEGGSLSFIHKNGGLNIRRLFNFDFLNGGSGDITLQLPQDYEGSIEILGSTGDVELRSFDELSTLSVAVSTGKITCEDVGADDMALISATGDMFLKNISSLGNLRIEGTTGSAVLENASADGELICRRSTGSISAENTSAQTAALTASTGDLRIERLDAQAITLKTTTGSVSGTVSGSDSDYAVTSSTNTGENNLPKKWGSGDKTLSVTTSTGDIHIEFAG